MDWLMASSVVGGLVAGFMAGASRESTGGTVAAAVAALELGVFGFRAKSSETAPADAQYVGHLFVVFLLCLVVAYAAANRLRSTGKLVVMGIGQKGGDSASPQRSPHRG